MNCNKCIRKGVCNSQCAPGCGYLPATSEGFLNLVRQMRNAEKEYFKSRDYKVLTEAKFLEKQVDKYLDDQLNGPDLF